MVYPGSGRRSVTPYVQFVVDSVARAKLHRGEYNGGERGPVPKSRVGDEEDEAWLRAPRVCACVGVKAKMKRMDSKSQLAPFYSRRGEAGYKLGFRKLKSTRIVIRRPYPASSGPSSSFVMLERLDVRLEGVDRRSAHSVKPRSHAGWRLWSAAVW